MCECFPESSSRLFQDKLIIPAAFRYPDRIMSAHFVKPRGNIICFSPFCNIDVNFINVHHGISEQSSWESERLGENDHQVSLLLNFPANKNKEAIKLISFLKRSRIPITVESTQPPDLGVSNVDVRYLQFPMSKSAEYSTYLLHSIQHEHKSANFDTAWILLRY